MTVTNFGDNFTIEEDSNGDYVVTYVPTDTVIERIDSGDEEKIFEVAAQISTLKGRTSGATVYDDATQTVGDGTTSAEHESVNAGEINTVRNAAEFADNGADGIQAALDDLPASGGKVFIPPGTYTVDDPGSLGDGIITNSFDGRVVVEGAGESTIIKLADNATTDYRSILRPTGNVVLRDFVLDGNRANQTDGGVLTNQLGIFCNSSNLQIRGIKIQNTQYGPIRSRTADNILDLGNEYINCGDGPRYDKSGSDEAKGVRVVGTQILNSGDASGANTGGLILGDGCNGSAVSNVVVRGASNGALRIEACENVDVSGGLFENTDSVVSVGIIQSNGVNFSGTVKNTSTGRGVFVDGGQSVSLRGTVRDVGGVGVEVRSTVPHSVETSIYNVGGTPLLLKGLERGSKIEPLIAFGVSGPAIRLEDDSGGQPCKNVKIGGQVSGAGNLTYAVQASDANQTALVDGLATSGMATGVVDNPGGLTVGDTI